MPENNKIRNKEIERRLTTVEVLLGDAKEDVKEIKEQVFNEIPHSIKQLETAFNNFKLSNSRWVMGILVSILFLLLATIFDIIK